MEVVINGKSEAGDFSTVEQMLRERGLDPYLVVVELNGKILQNRNMPPKNCRMAIQWKLYSSSPEVKRGRSIYCWRSGFE